MNDEVLSGIGRHIVTKILIVICTAALFGYLKTKADQWAGLEGNPRMASYPSGFRYMAALAWLVPAVFAYAAFKSASPLPEADRKVLAGIVAVFSLAIAAMTLEAFVVRIRWDDFGIEVRTPWRGYRKVPWGDLRRVDYSQTNRWFRIHTTTHGMIYLHDFMGGRNELLQEIRSHHEHVPIEMPFLSQED